jgi:hypothetical protein
MRSQTWQWSGRPTSQAFFRDGGGILGGPPLTAGVRRLRRDGSGEEMLYSPSAWAHDNVHP